MNRYFSTLLVAGLNCPDFEPDGKAGRVPLPPQDPMVLHNLLSRVKHIMEVGRQSTTLNFIGEAERRRRACRYTRVDYTLAGVVFVRGEMRP